VGRARCAVTGRFDLVVWNYARLDRFVDNFASYFRNLDPARDRITIVTSSESPGERRLADEFATRAPVPVRYLARRNRGIDQLARAEYFTGEVGGAENFTQRFIFQMQDHYLAPDAPESRWDERFDFGIKGDVVPDGVVFDLDRIEQLADAERLDGFFADRTTGCWMEVGGRRYIAPAGGNFAISTRVLTEEGMQEQIRALARSCDNSYAWAVYAEFRWGVLFFEEGRRYYDLSRDRVYDRWPRDDFYIAPDDYLGLMRRYESTGFAGALLRARWSATRFLGGLRR
jgi:hypothetical protein